MNPLNQPLRAWQIHGARLQGAAILAAAGLAAIALQLAPGISGLYASLLVIAVLLAGGIYARQGSKGAQHAASSYTRPEMLLATAIESTPNGLCIFDADLRVVISNSHFATMYGLTPMQTRPGTSLLAVLDSRAAASCRPPDAAEYVADCLRSVGSGETFDSTDELRNGNIIAVSRRPMLDGGLIEVHRDITDARLAEVRAEAVRQELIEKQYAIDQAVIVAVTDLTGSITYANDNFCRISGYSRSELLGRNHRILNSGAHSKEFFRDMYRCIAGGEVWRGELCNKSKSGMLYWVDTIITPQLGVHGKPIAYMAIRIDITARKHAEAQISYAATHDALTGLANRAALLERMSDALAHMQQHGGALTALMLDLDGFKSVNDTLGHAAGDTLLKELADRFESSLGDTDLIARLGGDEFAVIRTDMADQREDAIELAVRLLELAAKPFHLDGQDVCIGTSIGIALAPANGTDAGELLKKADLALYRVKSEGRNSFSFFDEDLSEKAISRLQLVNDMRAALSRNEFELHYQPLFDTATSRPCGMEALVRWRHPVAGLLYPDRFIGIAEETGLMEPLGQWILQRACADAVSWPQDIKVAVNLSAAQFRAGTLFDVILCVLVETGLPPERLELEITESLLLQDKDSNVLIIQQLKNIGIAIALDDFGTGYASLSYLLLFPFDKIKIDKSFTQGLLSRADCRAVVASILTLARGLEIAVTAEGVETNSQFELLRAQGVDYVQGYLFGRPCRLAELDFAALELIARADEAA
ncbi:EAL domain-containing protein [Bradyrhizobium sediminis]|uniref:EAL domain-containing protein n=1 Tax=Bradyrhizobium sediminis TaxID=2840469 RepID=A0A975NH45_9BRAD|nr:EAL domain-containing protein [Bradyrhizobium sediminis]QWG15048.1 EAL domain-containing protein [Bradyrhizobium sediminis]